MKSNRIIYIFIFVVFPFLLAAQTKETKLSFGISFSPDYAYRYLHTNNDPSQTVSMRNKLESSRLGFSTGLVAKYQLKKKWAVISGIQFRDKGEKIELDKEDFIGSYELENYDINIQQDPLIPNNLKTKFHYYYLGIPLKLNYYFSERRVRLFASAGISADFFLYGKMKYISEYTNRTERGTDDLDNNFHTVNFTGLTGVGLQTNITKQLRFCFEPVFRYAFTPLVDAPLKQHPYSIGANIVLMRNW